MAPMSTLYDVLRGAEGGTALILAGGGPRLTRGQLQGAIIGAANSLIASGVRPGDVVSIAMANTADFVVAFLAVTYARAVAAPLNAAYKEDEFEFYLEDAGSKLLLLPGEGVSAASSAAAKKRVPTAKLELRLSGPAPVAVLTALSGALKFPPATPAPTLRDAPRAADVALFLHTSGTTNRPKGVPLSHANMVASLQNIIATYELTPADRSYLVMPLFHVHGLMAGLLGPLGAGASVILPAAGRFGAAVFWTDCVEHQATFYTAVPTMHQILLARAAEDYPASAPPPLRFIRSCSSSLAAATMEKLEAAFKVPVLEAYAMTEASHQMTSNPLPKNGPHRAGSVGTAQGSMRVTILDAANKELPVGQIGEVCINGPNVTAGYLNNPAANAEAYAGGWFHTGDQGMLDAHGFLTLTGRLKELINRGGEKISPLEVDSALLCHPAVAEAVSFGAPDEKYGEVVAAVVVLKPGAAAGVSPEQLVQDIRKACGTKLSAYKVPGQIFITDVLPKTATGKIQRRHMVTTFMPAGGKAAPAAAPAAAKPAAAAATTVAVAGVADGYSVTASALAALGVKYMFGVIGIPVTPLASAAQAAGIRFIGFRNEQAAGYAAAAAGYLTGSPSALLTVSGPGAVHGIAGLSHAAINCWPLIMISGSCEQSELGKGSFQECDQVAAVRQFCKYAAKAHVVADIPQLLAAALQAATSGRPGAVYVDLPSDVLMAPAHNVAIPKQIAARARPSATVASLSAALALLRGASRPLLVVGKGAAQAFAETQVQELANRFGLPVLGTAMGRGVVPDSHPLVVNAARSLALRKADVVVVIGARLNWQLHFGVAPKWASDVQFILVDLAPSDHDQDLAKVSLVGDAAVVVDQLIAGLKAAPGLNSQRYGPWVSELQGKVQAATKSLNTRLSKVVEPLDYYTTLSVIRDAVLGVHPAPIVVSEGANTMDMARLILPALTPRSRLDAGTWGTMGVGMGYAIAAAVTQPERLTVAVEGDSAFGFSGMECETIARYKLPVVIFVFNNGGIYGGDRREAALSSAARQGASGGGFSADPAPTSFVPGSRYDLIMKAFGGAAYNVASAAELRAACSAAFAARLPALVNVVLDPMAGVESGNVHSFNAPASKL